MVDSVDLVKLRSQLMETYRKVTPLERVIIQLASVIYAPTNRTDFLDCLRTVVKEEYLKQLIPASFRTIVERLVKFELLVQSNLGIACHPAFVEIATREAIKSGTFEPMVLKVESELPIATSYRQDVRRFTSFAHLVREARIGIYRQDMPFVKKQIQDFLSYSYTKEKVEVIDLLHLVCDNPFAPEWFSTLSQDFYEQGMAAILEASEWKLTNADGAIALLEKELTNKGNHASPKLYGLWIQQLLLRGYVETAQIHLQKLEQNLEQTPEQKTNLKPENYQILWGWSKFLVGDNAGAIADLSKTLGKKTKQEQSLAVLILILALIKDGNYDNAATFANSRSFNLAVPSISNRLKALIQFQQGDQSQKSLLSNPIALDRLNYQVEHHDFNNCLDVLISSLCIYWVDQATAKAKLPNILFKFCRQAEAAGYNWIALQAERLLDKTHPLKSSVRLKTLPQEAQLISLVDLIQIQEPWEISLNALTRLQSIPIALPKSGSGFRLAWFITLRQQNWTIQPKEQKISAKGVWSAGRNIALKRLKKSGEVEYLSDHDLKVCAHIEVESDYYYGSGEYEFNERAIAALVGHPLVFWEDSPTTRVEIVKGEPELLVRQGTKDRLILEFSPPIVEDQEITVIKESPTKIKVIEVSPEHQKIAAILGNKHRLEVPAIAKDKVLNAINSIASIVTVHSDIGGGTEVEQVEALATPHFHLLPAGSGLKIAVLSRPFATGGSYYQPGKGGETVIAEIEGKRLQTTRNLKLEQKLATSAIADCPTLSAQIATDVEYIIDDPETCLEILLELQQLGDRAIIEWLQGQKFKIRQQSGLGDLRLTIQRQNDWFAAGGELKLSEEEVMDMQRLMELLGQTSSRFIPLGDGEFLALTQALRQQLDTLRAYSEKHGKGQRFHPLAAMALEDFVDAAGEVKADRHWQSHLKRLKEMKDLQPQVPKNLKAELRDYQIDGFNWMAKLAHWGVGACLADDMGLGKTLQALALILSRAAAGATLVVAPTSVCLNWVSEAERFAPDLNIIQFANLDKNRQETVDHLKPFDLLICSYGLLQQESVATMLAQVQWQTVVLDEAQWIKNFATKRSQGAMQLQAGFKLITTGTPIENHLGELWNLFRFINPGLLGSLERFNQDFANPIERSQDQQARERLRKLIQPFMLRRTKSQVLQELPPRTEILLHVDLSRDEIAMYEALRRQAIDRLTNSDATGGAKHLQMLAEIMKLRRMCCNPQLVMPEQPIPSSKLQLFGEVIGELLENNHKALVFSQFVDHLQIIRAYLDQQNISYQYLDGSTPAKERKKRVDAFQLGQGDVFLISLKAGGTGLNLTEADYVIHMDPWWNPAVEDQASDRAHRIGQQRPVTIYRLVAKNTIEEKIVDLHHHKRELADSLLEGTDSSGKISTDDLLNLITSNT
ncbi:DNA/RNA helicase, superfamily II, SNF2 family [Synechococcus sp. PCC 7502]|uniref:DEAD/DEAH box helicase n=1 Tax=Synechococcus sp. PCC 7502 TaxID=1173263 RepID=UPI00029F9EB8|nr:DEAD/DEAH box helicase [Synechococcus sp. PCC 7502]AFY72765.1 DNA/RNA helicase, superfamily II, SNF2 family [Synechococcus sp. PCC 7502]